MPIGIFSNLLVKKKKFFDVNEHKIPPPNPKEGYVMKWQ